MGLLQWLKDEFSDFGKKVPRQPVNQRESVPAQVQRKSEPPPETTYEASYPNAPKKFRTLGKESFETNRTKENQLFVKEFTGTASLDEMLATAKRNDKKASAI